MTPAEHSLTTAQTLEFRYYKLRLCLHSLNEQTLRICLEWWCIVSPVRATIPQFYGYQDNVTLTGNWAALHVGWSCKDDLNNKHLPADQNQELLWCGNPNSSFKVPL